MSITAPGPGLINGHVSHWFDGLPTSRAPLPGSRDADVCIVGAGYTGLWTAYYLKRADPSLRVVVLEARFAGFGASGRNGGWLSGLVPGDRERMAHQYGRDSVVAWQRALNDAVDEVIDVAAREGIDAGIVKGGTLEVARNPAQATRLAAAMEAERRWQVGGIEPLSKDDARRRIRLDGVVAAYHNPHCARVQPARLARGLADTVEGLGVDIYERSPVTELTAGRATTPSGTVSAPVVLRATEGFTAMLPGLKRRWLPMNSSMIATDPIPAPLWDAIGWQGRETLGDTAHGFFYAQRTVDDRIAIGGRSVPYRFGSRTDRDGRVPERTITNLPRHPARHPAAGRRRADRPRLVRCARGATGLGGDRRLRQGDRPRLGGRLRRARRHCHQPRGAHPHRSDPGPRDSVDHPAVGRSPVPELGTRTAALAGSARNVPGLQGGRLARGAGRAGHVPDRGRSGQDRRAAPLASVGARSSNRCSDIRDGIGRCCRLMTM